VGRPGFLAATLSFFARCSRFSNANGSFTAGDAYPRSPPPGDNNRGMGSFSNKCTPE
jgi:hypothetical protein